MSEIDQCAAAARRFNRFYTQRIGVLHEGLLRSTFSLTEVRVLYELAHRDKPTATELARELGLDPGYLSRILRGFKRRGLATRMPSKADARQSHLSLSKRGQAILAPLEQRAHEEVAATLKALTPDDRGRLTRAMQTIEALLGTQARRDSSYASYVSYVLRPHQPGDMGWVIHRHGVLYAEEYRWDERFEAMVAHIAAKFIEHYDPKTERCWIAEREGERVGSVFLVRQSKTVAKLRLLIVEPGARGLGIGARLVDECIRFARQAGYRKIMLWTNSVLRAARHLYEKAGFRLTREEPHRSFGHDLIGETWELKL